MNEGETGRRVDEDMSEDFSNDKGAAVEIKLQWWSAPGPPQPPPNHPPYQLRYPSINSDILDLLGERASLSSSHTLKNDGCFLSGHSASRWTNHSLQGWADKKKTETNLNISDEHVDVAVCLFMTLQKMRRLNQSMVKTAGYLLVWPTETTYDCLYTPST